jgi:hypothetical protein
MKWIDPATACEILDREHARGRVHQAFFKGATLDRFYVTCNCCSCCCGAMQAFRNGNPLLASSGYASQINPIAYIQCSECVERCPFGAISDAENIMFVDQDLCMGCVLMFARRKQLRCGSIQERDFLSKLPR